MGDQFGVAVLYGSDARPEEACGSCRKGREHQVKETSGRAPRPIPARLSPPGLPKDLALGRHLLICWHRLSASVPSTGSSPYLPPPLPTSQSRLGVDFG